MFPELSEAMQWNLTHHRPTESTIAQIEELRDAAKEFANVIEVFCPKARETSLAMTNLEQALMWAVASIARQNPADEPLPECRVPHDD